MRGSYLHLKWILIRYSAPSKVKRSVPIVCHALGGPSVRIRGSFGGSGVFSSIRCYMWIPWFSTLLREVFPRVLRFSPLTKHQLLDFVLLWFNLICARPHKLFIFSHKGYCYCSQILWRILLLNWARMSCTWTLIPETASLSSDDNLESASAISML